MAEKKLMKQQRVYGGKAYTLYAHIIQKDGYWYERTVWTDGTENFLKINGFVFPINELKDLEITYFTK